METRFFFHIIRVEVRWILLVGRFFFSCATSGYQIIYQFKRIYVRLQCPWWCAINGWTMMVIKMHEVRRLRLRTQAIDKHINLNANDSLTASGFSLSLSLPFCRICIWKFDVRRRRQNLKWKDIWMCWMDSCNNDDHLKNNQILSSHWRCFAHISTSWEHYKG